MQNLVKETTEVLKDHFGETSYEVLWVGSKDGEMAMAWDDFARKFQHVEYDCGFGGQEVASDLVVVGDDWWLEREEYDGAEHWEFKSLPQKADNTKTFDKVTANHCWGTLRELNNSKGE